MIESQLQTFLIFIAIGTLLGVLFDIFKSIRKSFKTPDIITYVEDFFFWVIAGVILIYSILVFNQGQIRGYIFFGIFIGSFTYSLTISKFSVIILTSVIKFLKVVFILLIQGLILPFKFFKKPIIIFSLNLKNFLKNFKFNKKQLNKEGRI